MKPMNRRPRRNRRSPVFRAAFQETSLTPANFVYPLFIHEGSLVTWCVISVWFRACEFAHLHAWPFPHPTQPSFLFVCGGDGYFVCVWTCLIHNSHLRRFTGEEDTPIGAMPGCYRLGWRHGLVEEVSILCQDLNNTIINQFSWTIEHSFNYSTVGDKLTHVYLVVRCLMKVTNITSQFLFNQSRKTLIWLQIASLLTMLLFYIIFLKNSSSVYFEVLMSLSPY